MVEHHRGKYNGENWPRRNDPLRATVVPQLSKSGKNELNNNLLSRCRSLEFLDGQKQFDSTLDRSIAKGKLHRSADLLNNTEIHEAVIHHDPIMDTSTLKSSSIHQSTNTSDSDRRLQIKSNHRHLNKQYDLDFREIFKNGLFKAQPISGGDSEDTNLENEH